MDKMMIFVATYILAVAGDDQLRTVYHDRIDGLILPACEPLEPKPWKT